MLGGGTIGVSRFSEKYEACMKFIRWLYRADIAEMICLLGGYICNRNIIYNFDVQERYPWIEHMEQSFLKGWRNYTSKYNPEFNEVLFEDVLGKAIREAASGIENAQTALKKAQQECSEIFG